MRWCHIRNIDLVLKCLGPGIQCWEKFVSVMYKLLSLGLIQQNREWGWCFIYLPLMSFGNLLWFSLHKTFSFLAKSGPKHFILLGVTVLWNFQTACCCE